MEQLLVFVLFLLSGYTIVRFGFANSNDYKTLANFVFYVCLPCSILVSFQGVEISPDIYTLLAILIASFVISSAVSAVMARALKLEKRVLYALLICGFFGNVVYFGFPFVEMTLGFSSLPLAGIYVAVYNIFVFALLLPILSFRLGKGGQNRIARTLVNPVVIFTLVGVASIPLHLDLSAAMPYLESFSALTTPLSLIAMGVFFSDKSSITIDRDLLSMVAAKCVFFPLITVSLLLLSGTFENGKEMLLLSLMPVAVSNFIIIDSLRLDLDKLVMDAIVVTSIVSTLIVLGLAYAGFF